MRGNVAAIVLVLVGTFFLLSNLGVIDISLAQLVKTWWPVILIAVGISLFFTPDKQKKD
jgi:predicted permease